MPRTPPPQRFIRPTLIETLEGAAGLSGKSSLLRWQTATTELRVVSGSWGTAPRRKPSFQSSGEGATSRGVLGPSLRPARASLEETAEKTSPATTRMRAAGKPRGAVGAIRPAGSAPCEGAAPCRKSHSLSPSPLCSAPALPQSSGPSEPPVPCEPAALFGRTRSRLSAAAASAGEMPSRSGVSLSTPCEEVVAPSPRCDSSSASVPSWRKAPGLSCGRVSASAPASAPKECLRDGRSGPDGSALPGTDETNSNSSAAQPMSHPSRPSAPR
mmetsp:Transcript_12252/g.29088  ORF Transcript_12252/g.29088 Transcript_12252/m.29088 type:complete len:271 (-) Transcript_12252:522-1334(-)